MPLTNRSKILLLGGLTLATVGLAVAWPKKASAATRPESEPEPSQPSPTPADGMPWMRYSSMTLSQQRAYNQAASAQNESQISEGGYAEGEGVGLYPLLKEDGILGPDTCEALTYNMPRLKPGYRPPMACAGRI